MKAISFALTIVVHPVFCQSALAQSCANGGTCIQSTPPDCRYTGERVPARVYGGTASVMAEWKNVTPETRSAAMIANPPSGYLLWNYSAVVASSNNGSHTASRMAGGLNFNYEEVIDETYQSALDIAGKIVDGKERQEAELRIKDARDRHKRFFQQISTNKDTVRVEVTASADGSFVNRKRGWHHVDVFLDVVCMAPVNLKEQVLSTLKLDKTLEGVQQSSIFHNTEGTRQYVSWKAVDRNTKCSVKPEPGASIVVLDPGQRIEIPLDLALSVCYSFGPTLPARSEFKEACRIRVGNMIEPSAACKR